MRTSAARRAGFAGTRVRAARTPPRARSEPMEPRRLLSVQMLGDINTAPLSPSDPLATMPMGEVVAVGDTVYFSVDDARHGQELWRTDPGGGASLVKDIYPGIFGSKPSSLAAVGDTLYFAGTSPVTGTEVWKSDGTAAGTVMIADLKAGAQSSLPYGFTRLGDAVYFLTSRFDSVGYELWKTDGTAAGTSVVRRVNPPNYPQGFLSSPPTAPVVLGNRLVFGTAASLANGGGTLWASDGTAAGTAPIASFPATNRGPGGFARTADGTLFFAAPSGTTFDLWKTDGTAGGTAKVGSAHPSSTSGVPDRLTAAGNAVYFRATDAANGPELWRSDGTAAGTRLVKDIRPGTSGSSPGSTGRMTAAADGSVYFSASDGTHGSELWRSDGTEAGTAMVADLAPGSGSSTPSGIAAVGSSVYFFGGAGLYRTDGTEAGTTLLRQFRFVTGAIVPAGGAGRAYFFADDGTSGMELWRTDGTPGGTALVQDVYPVTRDSTPQFLASVGNTAYFFAADATHGRELWKTDGTVAGTVLVKDINPGATGSRAFSQTSLNVAAAVLNNVVYFTADDGTHGNELWRSDGTAAGTYLVKNITADSGTTAVGSSLAGYTALDGAVYFASVTTGDLYRTDGTDAGTVLVSSKAEFTVDGVLNGRLLLTGYDTAGTELWTSDGTDAGTRLIKSVAGSNTVPLSAPPKITADGTTAYFFVEEQYASGNVLWKTDGTPEGTVRVADIRPGADDWDGGGLGLIGSRLFFSSEQGAPGRQVWTSDGTAAGTKLVKEIPDPIFLSVDNFIDVNGTLVFRAGAQVWRSDGTDAGTFSIADVPADTGYPLFGGTAWQVFNGAVYFPGTGSTGNTLWKSDGTAAGTVPVAALVFRAFPITTTFLPLGNSLLFTGDDRLHGTELWRLADDGRAPAVADARLINPGDGSVPRLQFTFDQPMTRPTSFGFIVRIVDAATGQAAPLSSLAVVDGPDNVLALDFPLYAGGFPAGAYRATLVAGSVAAADGDALPADYTTEFAAGPASVAAGHVFYNNSAADGASAAANVRDDDALAPAAALRPGGAATAANVSHYSRGINGVMVDVAAQPLQSNHPAGPDDFEFAVGDGTTWSPAPRPTSVTYRTGAGVDSSTRLTILWPDGAIRNQWLRVTVKPTPNTGLAAPDVFYFGHLAGDTADAAPGAAATVNSRDLAAVRAHLFATTPADLARFDFDGDGRVAASDVAVVRANLGTRLPWFTAPSAPPAAASRANPAPSPSPRSRPPRRSLLVADDGPLV